MSPIERSSGGGGGGGGFSNPMTTAGDIIIEDAAPAPARLGIGSTGQALEVSGGLPAWSFPPGFEFGYDQITASVTVSSRSEAAPTTLITCAAHVFDGAPVIAAVYAPFIANPSANSIDVSIYEGGTELACYGGDSFTGGIVQQTFYAELRFTPTAASHSYVLGGFTNAGSPTNGTFGAGAGGAGNFAPAFVRFTKV